MGHTVPNRLVLQSQVNNITNLASVMDVDETKANDDEVNDNDDENSDVIILDTNRDPNE